jgi:hypothetical protein
VSGTMQNPASASVATGKAFQNVLAGLPCHRLAQEREPARAVLRCAPVQRSLEADRSAVPGPGVPREAAVPVPRGQEHWAENRRRTPAQSHRALEAWCLLGRDPAVSQAEARGDPCLSGSRLGLRQRILSDFATLIRQLQRERRERRRRERRLAGCDGVAAARAWRIVDRGSV